MIFQGKSGFSLSGAVLIALFAIMPLFLAGADVPNNTTATDSLAVVTMCVDPDFYPYEMIDDQGNHLGIAADLLKIISERSGIRFEIVPTTDWRESLEGSRSGECTILSCLNKTESREEWLLFTEPYFTDYTVFITRQEHPYIANPALLNGKTIALPYSSSAMEWIKNDYPQLIIEQTENNNEALKLVNTGKVDMTLMSLSMAAYTIRNEGWFNLKIAGQMQTHANQLRIGVSKNNPGLVERLDAAIATLTYIEVEEALNQHISLTMVEPFNYSLLWYAGIGVLVIITIGLIWNRQLHQFNKQLNIQRDELAALSQKQKKDIEARKKVEEELRTSEKKYRLITENSSDVIWVLNIPQNRFTYISPSITSLRGLTVEEALNESLEQALTPESLKVVMAVTEKDLNLFLSQPEMGSRRAFTEIQQPCKNGEIIWVEVATNFQMNSNGEVEVLGVSRNIQERKMAESRLRDTALRYQAFIDATNTGAWELNIKTMDVWYSPQYFIMLGYNRADYDFSQKDVRQSLWKELMYPDDVEPTNAYLLEYIKNPKGNYEVIFRMIHKSGRTMWILSRGKLIDGPDGSGRFLVGTHIDITDRKEAEELLISKNKELESYLYVTSHDLRSPLINVQGFSARVQRNIEKLKDKLWQNGEPITADEELTEIVDGIIPKSISVIQSNVEKMNSLINGLLTISRTGRVKMNIAEIDMNELFARIIRNAAFQIENIGANISVNPLPPCYGDQELLSQLFTNLIDNAIKYRHPSRQLTIAISSQSTRHHHIYKITDNGNGISEHDQKKIWDVFFRANPQDVQKGEGIGLNLVARITEKHRGTTWVESTPDEGSTFFVKLPAREFRENG